MIQTSSLDQEEQSLPSNPSGHPSHAVFSPNHGMITI